jgi:hypothetical protein
MSDSAGGVGGAGAGGGANVHGSNDTHDTHGADGAGSANASSASAAGSAQASAPAGDAAASAQASADSARAHPEAHFSSEAPNPTGPTPGQVDSLTSANVATPMSLQAQMSTISQTTAAVQQAAESAAAIGFSPPSSEAAPAESAFSIANSPATVDGRPKADPKAAIGAVDATFSQTVDADKPSVTVTMKNPGVLAAGDGVTVSAVLHDAAAPKRTGVPSLDVTATYDSVLSTPAQEIAASSVPAPEPVTRAQFGLGLTGVGTPNMTVNADAVLKGVTSSFELKAGYDFKAQAFSLDGKLSIKQVDVFAHQDWSASGASSTTVGVQYNFTDNVWAKVEARNKADTGSSFYAGFGLKSRF